MGGNSKVKRIIKFIQPNLYETRIISYSKQCPHDHSLLIFMKSMTYLQF